MRNAAAAKLTFNILTFNVILINNLLTFHIGKR